MKLIKAGYVLMAVAALTGCRQELAQLTYLLNDSEPLQITRGLLPDKALVDFSTTTSAALGACVQAPSAWGGPTSVTVAGSYDDGASTLALDPPATDAATAATAEALLPRNGYTWYCYEETSRTYGAADSGSITWEFAADDQPARVITSIGSDDGLYNLAVHEVRRGTELMTGDWQPQDILLQGDTPAALGTAQSWALMGSFNGQALVGRGEPGELTLVAADGTVTVDQLPFTPLYIGITDEFVAAGPGVLVAFEETGGGTTATPYTSSDGTTWQASPDTLPGNQLLFVSYNSGLGQFVAAVAGNTSLFYSADGIDWSTSRDTGAAATAATEPGYAFLANGTEACKAEDSNGDDGLFARAPSGSFVQVLERPAGGSVDWQVQDIVAIGGRFFATTYDPAGATGVEHVLLTSTDGGVWTELTRKDSQDPSATLLGLAIGERVLVSWDNDFWVSPNGGDNFTALLASDVAGFLDNWLIYPVQAFTVNGRGFLVVSLSDSGSGSYVSAALATEDGENFSLMASQAGRKGGEFPFAVLAAGDDVIQVGEDPDGFQLYRLLLPVVEADSGDDVLVFSSSGGGTPGLALFALLVMLAARRRRWLHTRQ